VEVKQSEGGDFRETLRKVGESTSEGRVGAGGGWTQKTVWGGTVDQSSFQGGVRAQERN